MTRAFLLLALAWSLALAATPAWVREPTKLPVVGVLALASGPDDPIYEPLWRGLSDLGYVEGRTMSIEFRSAEGQPARLTALAEELVQLKVDVIIAGTTPSAQAAKRVTSSIPIVMTFVTDPIGSGLVENLAHPGGNVTGVSTMSADLSAKRLQLLKEMIPRLARVAVLWNPDTPYHPKIVEDLKAVAPSLAIKLSFASARTPQEVGPAFSAIRRARAQALYIINDGFFYSYRMRILDQAAKANLPITYGERAFADAGALMSYGPNYPDVARRSALYVDKILKGAKPGDLPVEQPTKFELVINLKAAKALGLTIPESILILADEVIK